MRPPDKPCEDSGEWPQVCAVERQPAASREPSVSSHVETLSRYRHTVTCKRVGVLAGCVLVYLIGGVAGNFKLSAESASTVALLLPLIAGFAAAVVAGQAKQVDFWDLLDAAVLPLLFAHGVKFMLLFNQPQWLGMLPVSLALGVAGVVAARLLIPRRQCVRPTQRNKTGAV